MYPKISYSALCALLLTAGCSSASDEDDPVPGLSGLTECLEAAPVAINSHGLPQYQSNPGAPITLFIDYDGGRYHSTSLGDRIYKGYNRPGSDPATFDAQEQEDILSSLNNLHHYFAMFDVNVTTIDSVREASDAWSWIMVTEEETGGRATLDVIGRYPYARAYVGASTVRIEDKDKSRRIAHEIGHNFNLRHSGIWEEGHFYKWEDWSEWDEVYGPIMGGGGHGQRVGWSDDVTDKHETRPQDRMQVIRDVIASFDPSSTGWRADDYDDSERYAFCSGNRGGAYREGILEKPSDKDVFEFRWGGGKLELSASAVKTSAALLDIALKNSASVEVFKTQNESNTLNLPPGVYSVEVQSQGGYGELGSYRIRLSH